MGNTGRPCVLDHEIKKIFASVLPVPKKRWLSFCATTSRWVSALSHRQCHGQIFLFFRNGCWAFQQRVIAAAVWSCQATLKTLFLSLFKIVSQQYVKSD